MEQSLHPRSLVDVVGWLARHPEGFAGLFGRNGYSAMLPLLEVPYLEVADGLRQSFRDFGLSDADFQSISLSGIVVHALSSESVYWECLALSWLAHGFPTDDDIVHARDELDEIKRGVRPAKSQIRAQNWYEETYGRLGRTTDEILSHARSTKICEVLGALRYRIHQKIKAHGERSLTDTERRLLAVGVFDDEISNGGFEQFFSNPSGNFANEALEGLRAMGATESAMLLERGMAVFPGGKPPADQDTRERVMWQIAAQSESVWKLCNDEIDEAWGREDINELSLAYAIQKRAEIVLPGC